MADMDLEFLQARDKHQKEMLEKLDIPAVPDPLKAMKQKLVDALTKEQQQKD